jgi:hypothetical protein
MPGTLPVGATRSAIGRRLIRIDRLGQSLFNGRG